jgi:hypothetical protein
MRTDKKDISLCKSKICRSFPPSFFILPLLTPLTHPLLSSGAVERFCGVKRGHWHPLFSSM